MSVYALQDKRARARVWGVEEEVRTEVGVEVYARGWAGRTGVVRARAAARRVGYSHVFHHQAPCFEI
jgi:hypothetical protein